MKKNAIILILVMLFNKLFGIGREMVLASMFGTSITAEAYNIAYSIPITVFSFVATGITTAYIPVFSRALRNEGDEAAERFTSNVLNILIIVFALLAVVSQFFTKEIVLMFASGFKDNPELLSMTISFTKITLFGVVFQGIFAISQGFLQLKNDFFTSGFSYIIMNITLIVFLYVTGNFSLNPILLAVGIFLSNVFQAIFTYIYSRVRGFKHSPIIDFKDEHLRALAIMAVPVILGSSVDVINTMIDKNLASTIMDGGVSTMNYAIKISDSILGLFVSTAATVLFPTLSKYAAEGNFDLLRNTLKKTFNAINLLVIPASFGLMIFSEPIVNLFYGRGKFTPEAVQITAQVLLFYSIGTMAIGNRQIVYRVFHSTQDTRTPVIVGILNVLLKALLSFMLVYSLNMGINGLALATSVAGLVSFVGSLFLLWRKIGGFDVKGIITGTVKITIASIIMAIAARFSYDILITKTGGLVALFLGVAVGVVVYAISIVILRVDVIEDTLTVIKKKLFLRKK